MSAQHTGRHARGRTGRHSGFRVVRPDRPVLLPVTAPAAERPPASSATFATISRRYVAWLVALDTLGAVGIFALVDVALRTSTTFSPTVIGLAVPGLAGVSWPIFVAACGGYRRSRIGIGTSELRAVLRAALWLPALGAYPAALSQRLDWLLLVVLSAPLVVGTTVLVRGVARRRLHSLQKAGHGCRRTLAVGPADAVAALHEHLSREKHCAMAVVAACLPGGRRSAASALTVPVLGDLHDVRRLVDAGRFEAVAVTGGACMEETYLRHLAWSLEGTAAELLISPGLVEIVRPRLDIRPLVGVPLLHVQQPRFDGWQHAVKRGFDVALTSIGLALVAPLLAAVALAIKLEDGGPVFFRQTRIGRGGLPFTMLKFRSMVVDAEDRKAALLPLNEGHGGLFKLSHDPRVTRIGAFIRRWSIDELPQLVNVLSGSMSLVGPRPHLAGEIASMPPDASRRSLVTPGLTGLWQINGRSDLPGEEGLRLDLRYVENWTLALDLRIIWRTIWAVLRRSGAC